MEALVLFLFATVGLVVLVAVAVYILVPLCKALAWIVRHVFAFLGGMVGSFLRVVGGVIASLVFLPLIILNIIVGRWSAAGHFGRSLQDEFRAVGVNTYRFFIGHPARFLLLSPLLEGLERRVPQAVAQAPTRDTPRRRAGQFEGYEIVGSLRGGGSGGRLYIAKPDEKKRAQFARRGFDADTVVIKTFSLADGSSLPQIVRESRALDAAKKLGLVLEHELTDKRFFYVMRYVPGDTLSVVTQRLHERSGPQGLRGPELRDAITYACDLTAALDMYHRGGLWHKDVKPDNIIVHDGRAHLVDFGLVTPLRSAMTLTTHGTEYFRDPEMVRLALRGVKVHEVNGAKFDVFGAGAVLYSILENSFPAHGVLSQVSKKCPDTLKWIVRRAMADYDNRYETASHMLADLEFVRDAHDPFGVRVADLPSMRGVHPDAFASPAVESDDFPAPVTPVASAAPGAAHATPASYTPPVREEARAGSPVPPHDGAGARTPARPNIVVTNWWTGGFRVNHGAAARTNSAFDRAAQKASDFIAAHKRGKSGFFVNVHAGAGRPAGHGLMDGGRTAAEQLQRARARAHAAQERARRRMTSHRAARSSYGGQINLGVGVSVLIFLGGCVFLAGVILISALNNRGSVSVATSGHELDVEVASPGADAAVTLDARTASAVARALRTMNFEFSGDLAHIGDQVRDIVAQAQMAAIEAYENEAVEYDDIIAIDPEDARDADDGGGSTVNPALLFAGRWLVLDDAPVDGPARETVNAMLASLSRAGVPLLTARNAEGSEDVELLAGARAAAGMTLPGDPGASARVLAWLRERSGEGPVGVLRIARADEPGRVAAVVITNAAGLGDAMRAAVSDAAAGELRPFRISIPRDAKPARAPKAR